MWLDMAIFIVLAYFYKYVTIENASKEAMQLASAKERERRESEEKSLRVLDETVM